jgi:hypothetical protein
MKIIKNALSFADRGQKAFWLMALVALVTMPLAAQAQETNSAIRGRVLDGQGTEVAGATILVEDLRTNSRQSFTTNNSGVFFAANLDVGGPYRITVNNDQSTEIPSLALGDILNVTINLQSADMEEIVAIGRVTEMFETAPGPTATFGQYDLDSAVAFNRDIKDVYAIDPRLNLDGFEVNCAGKHPRFNSITLDGVSHNDRFGLNSNGYSTATGMPFPYDAIQQVSVELAPFDVTYGGFSACNVNAVTKSGSNEWEFGVFYETTTDSLINDELDGQDLSSKPYREVKRGFSLGGPIMKDRLFAFATYEESEEPRFLAAGPAGSGNGEERDWLSQSDYQRILDIVDEKYGFDPGAAPGNGAQTTESFLVRLDWDITDRHSIAGIYNFYEGSQDRSSDSDPNEFEFSNHFYVKGSKSETYTAIIDSQWTDALSTQIYYSDTRMDDSQVTVGPKDIGDHQIEIGAFPNQNIIYLGADDSRQANSLYTDAQLLKLSAQYLAGDHIISAGYEHEELEVFNIFVQHSRGGEWDYRDSSVGTDPACFGAGISAQDRFDEITVDDSDGDPGNNVCAASGIDYFELGRPYQVYYGSGGGTNIATDAAAQFVNELNALYVQDEIYLPHHDLTLTVGLRYEWMESDDTPTYNSNLSDAVGVRNDSGLDGVDLLMPRFGFSWGVNENLTLRGGAGLYSGGNPNVWVANAWSRDGITQVQLREVYRNSASIFDGTLETIDGPVGGAIPQVLFDEIAAISGSAGSVEDNVLISPDYKQPREWKYALGASWDTGFWDITADIDYMYTRLMNSALYTDLAQRQEGKTLAGAPIYGPKPGAGENNLMLTNASDTATGSVFSVILRKDFDWGLDLLLGYAYTDVEDVSPMTSFTAESSFFNLATNNINNPSAGLSNYSVRDRVTLRASYAREFWGDNTTRFTLMGYYGSGQPTTYTMTSEDELAVGFFGGALLYVPRGPNDPNVIFGDKFDQDAFFSFVQANGLAPGFVSRNSIESKGSTRFDLRIDQEIPLYFDDLKARAFVKVYNFTNMLNDDWGRQYDAPFNSAGVVDIEVDDSGAYIFNTFDPSDTTDLQTFSSLWEVRLGLEVNFR